MGCVGGAGCLIGTLGGERGTAKGEVGAGTLGSETGGEGTRGTTGVGSGGAGDGVGGIARRRRCATFAKALRMGGQKVRGSLGESEGEGFSRRESIALAVCFKYASLEKDGKGHFSGKKSTLSMSRSFIVLLK